MLVLIQQLVQKIVINRVDALLRGSFTETLLYLWGKRQR